MHIIVVDSRYGNQEVMVRGGERIPNFLRFFPRRHDHPVRFDMLKSEAKASRAKFKIYESNYAEDLEFCNALFSYVLLSTKYVIVFIAPLLLCM